MKSEEIFLYLKMSIFQFFVKIGFSFYNRDREVIFDLLTNNKINTQNKIIITEDNDLVFVSCVIIDEDFIDYNNLMVLVNCFNEIFGIFSCYIQKVEEEKEKFSLFYMKAPIHPKSGDCIDEDFWRKQLTIHINSISTILDFIFFKFPESKFYKNYYNNKNIDCTEEFKKFLSNSIENYIESLKILKEEQEIKEINYDNWNKEEISEEIDKELKKYSNGEKNIEKLNKLSKAFFKDNVKYS